MISEIRPFRLPMRTEFRGLTQRRGCLLKGSVGWGEFAPFDDYAVDADARWLDCALEQAGHGWPAPVRDRVQVNAIIAQVEPGEAAAIARRSPCDTIKIKVGDEQGLQRVSAVREARPDAQLRIDVNGGWTLPQAVEQLRAFRPLDLQYAEQPVRSAEDMRRLREEVDVPLAADEIIRIDRNFEVVRDVADVAVLKVAPLGGVKATLAVAQQVGVPVVVSSALDSSLGLAASVAAACCLPTEPLACGLDTGTLLDSDTAARLTSSDGWMAWTDYPQPRADLEPDPEDYDYWMRRLDAAQAFRQRNRVAQ